MTILQVSPKTVQKMLDDGEAVLVDVRENDEYKKAHIAQARLLPLSMISLDAAHLPAHKDKKLIVHCRSGKRSMMACEKLQAEAPKQDFYNMEGGIMAWEAQGLDVRSNQTDYVLDYRAQMILGLVMVAIFLLMGTQSEIASQLLVVLGVALFIDGMFSKGWFAGFLSSNPKREK